MTIVYSNIITDIDKFKAIVKFLSSNVPLSRAYAYCILNKNSQEIYFHKRINYGTNEPIKFYCHEWRATTLNPFKFRESAIKRHFDYA